jgi:hypothetical protein
MVTSISESQPVDMPQFKQLLTLVSPEISICVRGRHAVGKSEGVYQAAASMRHEAYKNEKICAKLVESFKGKVKHPEFGYVTHWEYDYGIPVVERRLSQMTEGDIIGLPFKHGRDTFDTKTGERLTFSSTQFKACDWLLTSSMFPVVLFMDERNRALPGVKQAVFQLTDSKAFYGNVLHGDTRIVIAENVGEAYQVESNDPAEISRCATVELDPTPKDYIDYIRDRCNPVFVEFLQNHESLIEHRGVFEPNKKYPDRRAWFKLDAELTRLGIYEDPSHPMFHSIVGAFVGVEPKTKFVNYIKEHSRQVSAKDILTNWTKAKKRLTGRATISAESYVECGNKIVEHIRKNDLDEDQAYELSAFMFDAPAEIRMLVFAEVSTNLSNMGLVHPYVRKLIVRSTNQNNDAFKDEEIKLPPKKKSTSSKTSSQKATRGGKK